MIPRNIVEEALKIAMSTGADFAELFAEHTEEKTIHLLNSHMDSIEEGIIQGASIRIMRGTFSVHAATTDISRAGLLMCAKKVSSILENEEQPTLVSLKERIYGDIHPIQIVPSSVKNPEKINFLKEACDSALAYHTNIVNVKASLIEADHQILIANSEGLYAEDRQVRTRMMVHSVAGKDNELQIGSCTPGERRGLELFDFYSPKDIGRKAAEQAIIMINAGYCKAGRMPVAIANGFGGVILHEACGHSLEASKVALGLSQFCGKLGQQIANPKVTAIDDGTIPNAWGSINIDDEGNPAQKNVLIENGILKSYMVDKLSGRILGLAPTGNTRRQGYIFSPESRMTNTYIANGSDTDKDIISSIEYGLYAKEMGGGSVSTATGEFNFAVREAYMIRNGEIKEPVRGASLVGKGSDVLMKLDMVGQDLAFAPGMCGSSSGSIPTNVGQPLIRVSDITVGGR